MSLADQARSQAYNQTVRAAELQVAKYLKQSWGSINVRFNVGVGEPSDDQFMTMARELIDSQGEDRGFHFNNRHIRVADLDRELQNEPNRTTLNNLGVSSLNQLIPTRNQVNMIANEVGEGVRENTGYDMLGGASILGLFVGFFKWVFSGFEGGFTGLKTKIAEYSANNMQNSVGQRLSNLRNSWRGTPNDFSHILTDSNISTISTQVRSSVISQVDPTQAPPEETLGQVNLGGIDDTVRNVARSRMRDEFHTSILRGFQANRDFAEIFEEPPGGRLAPGVAPTFKPNSFFDAARSFAGLPADVTIRRNVVQNVANGVSDHISTIITDPNYVYNGSHQHLQGLRGRSLASMSAEDRARVIGAEARDKVNALRPANASASEGAYYTLIAETLPDQIQQAILGRNNDIPWQISGQQLENNAPTRSSERQQTQEGQQRVTRATARLIADGLHRTIEDNAEMKALVLQLTNNQALQDAHYLAVGTATVSAVNNFDSEEKKQKLANLDITTINDLNTQLFTELQRNRNNINGAVSGTNLGLTNAELQVLADNMTIQIVRKNAGENAEIPPDILARHGRNMGAVAVRIAQPQISAGVTEQGARINQLLTANGATELTPAQLNTIGSNAATVLGPLAMNRNALSALDLDGVRNLSTQISNSIRDNSGLNLPDSVRNVIADGITHKFLASQLGDDNATVVQFGAQVQTNIRSAVNGTITPQVTTEINNNTATINRLLVAQGNNELTANDTQNIATSASGALTTIMLTEGQLDQWGANSAQNISDQVFAALRDNPQLQIHNDIKRLIADKVALGFINKLPNKDELVNDEFLSAARDRTLAAANTVIAPMVRQKLGENSANINRLIRGNNLGTELDDPQLDAITNAASGVLQQYAADPSTIAALGALGNDAASTIANQVYASLDGNPNIGVDDSIKRMLANNIAVNFLRSPENAGVTIPADFLQASRDDELRLITGTVQTELSTSLTSQRALLTQLATQADGTPATVSDDAITLISQQLAPRLAQHVQHWNENNQKPTTDDYNRVTSDISLALNDEDFQRRLTAMGVHFSAHDRDALSITIAQEFVNSQFENAADRPALPNGFAQTRDEATRVAANDIIRPSIGRQLNANIVAMRALEFTSNGRNNIDENIVADVAAAYLDDFAANTTATPDRTTMIRDLTTQLRSRPETGIANDETARTLATQIVTGYLDMQNGAAPAEPTNFRSLVSTEVSAGVNQTAAFYQGQVSAAGTAALVAFSPIPGTSRWAGTAVSSIVNKYSNDIMNTTNMSKVVTNSVMSTFENENYDTMTPQQREALMRRNLTSALNSNYASIFVDNVNLNIPTPAVSTPLGNLPAGNIPIGFTISNKIPGIKQTVIGEAVDKIMDKLKAANITLSSNMGVNDPLNRQNVDALALGELNVPLPGNLQNNDLALPRGSQSHST